MKNNQFRRAEVANYGQIKYNLHKYRFSVLYYLSTIVHNLSISVLYLRIYGLKKYIYILTVVCTLFAHSLPGGYA